MLIAFIIAALAYGASSVAYGLARVDEKRDYRRARLIMLIAACLHVVVIGEQCLAGIHPLVSVFQMVSLTALLAVVGYLLVSLQRKSIPALGAILAPVALISLTLGTVTSGNVALREYEFPRLIVVHVVSASVGVAAVGLAAGIAGLYLALERRIRTKVFRPLRGALSLTSLERLHYNLMLFVVPVFTVALVSGAVVMMLSETLTIWNDRLVEFSAAALAWLISMAILSSRVLWGGSRSSSGLANPSCFYFDVG